MSSYESEPSLTKTLRDLTFQDWLISQSLLVRNDFSEKSISFTGRVYEPDGKIMQFLELLSERQGYLVANQEIIELLYGKVPVQHEDKYLKCISSWGNQIRSRKLSEKEALFHSWGIGWGLGLDELRIGKFGLLSLYQLWKNFSEPMSDRELAHEVYGYSDDSILPALHTQLQLLRRQFIHSTNTQITLSFSHDRTFNYTLATAHRDSLDSIFEGSEMKELHREFDDWLMSDSMRLLSIQKDEYEHMTDLNLNRKDHLLLHILQESLHHFVPFELLSQKLYGNRDEVSKVKSIYHYLLKTGMLPRHQAYLLHEYGIGLGIQEFGLTALELRLVHVLWSYFFTPVPKVEIIQNLYQVPASNFLLYDPRLGDLIRRTNKALAQTPFSIQEDEGQCALIRVR